ncbi:MAG TPA: ATP-binding protein [Gemmatimonadaceae bacterium]|nr:ATP-binding protein [Gemmatimonadaceae bacterium]
MKSPGFRTRLFAILSLFALVPALTLTLAWGVLATRTLPLVSGSAAWERVAESGRKAVDAVGDAPLTAAQRRALRAHELELEESVTQARRFRFLATRLVPVVVVSALVALAVLWVAASRVAGHLSRQMSRPLDELVGWTGRIERGLPLPEGDAARGAPEFGTLRERMRAMARELAIGRDRALEAERLRAYRETAQRVAHEIKNPLTPIQFAVARLRRDATDAQRDALDVLETETRRLDVLARSFSQFGRLPSGPAAEVDMAELARYAAQASVPPGFTLSVDCDAGLPLVLGHHDALQRALGHVLLNAVDACGGSDGAGTIRVRVERTTTLDGRDAVRLAVTDSGRGIDAALLPSIWDPYVTHKAGGTGLGLAIARQTILAHHGVVHAESTPGVGTTIAFVLPVAPPPPNTPVSSPASPEVA